jgi:acetyl esterase
VLSGPGDPDVTAVDATAPGPAPPIPVRIYTPAGGPGRRPLIVYYHGGGWVIGGLATHDGVCRDLAADTDAVIVSVEYRLAPEHQFPAAVEDAVAALEWAHDHAGDIGGDPARVAVAGDSAGGNLAAVVAMLAQQQHGPPLRFQLLVYPVVGVREEQASVRDNAEGYLLTRRDMEWFTTQYVGEPDGLEDPRFDPITGDLAGVAPAHIMTAEFDPLRDGGAAYAARLEEFGVPVTLRCYDGMIHGSFGMQAVVPASRDMIRDAATVLREALAADLASGRLIPAPPFSHSGAATA